MARRPGAEDDELGFFAVVMNDPGEGFFRGEPCLAASRNFGAHEPPRTDVLLLLPLGLLP